MSDDGGDSSESGEEGGVKGKKAEKVYLEGELYSWFEGVAKDVSFAHTVISDECRLCEEEVTKAERDACTAIACNMCNWVWHLDCLTPHITAEQCANAAFFACGEECTQECAEFLE